MVRPSMTHVLEQIAIHIYLSAYVLHNTCKFYDYHSGTQLFRHGLKPAHGLQMGILLFKYPESPILNNMGLKPIFG